MTDGAASMTLVDDAQAVHVEERRAVAAIVRKLSVARPPVGITFFRETPPPEYEAANVPACALIREAELGRRIYVDSARHDCIVGQYHLGLGPPMSLITEGHYLTLAQGFYTPEGARATKANSYSLAQGSITAMGAAPLADMPIGVSADLLVLICPPQQAMIVAGASAVRIGEFPLGDLGAATCSSVFAAPRLTGNSVFSLGDSNGRAFNKMDAAELFVVVPRERFRHLLEMMDNFWVKPAETRRLIHPSYAPRGDSDEGR